MKKYNSVHDFFNAPEKEQKRILVGVVKASNKDQRKVVMKYKIKELLKGFDMLPRTEIFYGERLSASKSVIVVEKRKFVKYC